MQADNDNELPRTRAEAKAVGSKFYFTGEPCKHGHVAARLTSNRCCVTCSAKRTEEWRIGNPDKLLAYRKTIYAENKDQVLSNWAAWYEENRDRELEKKRARYAENRDSALEYARQYREANPDKVKAASARWRTENPDKVKEGWAKWYEENGRERDARVRATPKGRIDGAMSRSIYGAIRDLKAGRKWESLVGYSLNELMAHLERLFLPGMTWENYGFYGWHIDHKIPKSVFNYERPNDIDFHRCWALSNLQPLWAADNIAKGARLDAPFQPSLALAG